MPAPCLASTGSHALLLLGGGLTLVLAGLALWRRSLRAAVTVVILAGLALPLGGTREASASCGATTTSTTAALAPLHGSFVIEGGTLDASDTPVVTVTNGATTVTGTWSTPVHANGATTFSFQFANLAAGAWTLEVVAPASLSLVLQSSTPPFDVTSDANTSGAFDATTADVLTVGSSPVTVTITTTLFT